MTYSEAIDLLEKHRSEFKVTPKFGHDVGSEHELFLVKHAGSPVFLVDWPTSIKPFYMRPNDSNPNLVRLFLESILSLICNFGSLWMIGFVRRLTGSSRRRVVWRKFAWTPLRCTWETSPRLKTRASAWLVSRFTKIRGSANGRIRYGLREARFISS